MLVDVSHINPSLIFVDKAMSLPAVFEGAMAVPRMALSPNGLFPEPPLVWAFTECPYMGPFIEQFILETHCLR